MIITSSEEGPPVHDVLNLFLVYQPRFMHLVGLYLQAAGPGPMEAMNGFCPLMMKRLLQNLKSRCLNGGVTTLGAA
jgi:hypothetical protein